MLRSWNDAARRPLAPSKFTRTIAGISAVLAVVIGTAVAAAAASSSPACPNPLAETHNFTVVVENDAALGSTGAGGEIEGSLAAGGNVSFGLYNLLKNTDGSALPSIGSPATQLLVGGAVDYSSGQKLDLNAGSGKITDTRGLSVTADGRLMLDDTNRYIKSQAAPGQDSVPDYTAAPGTFSKAFPADYFDRLRTLSAQYTAVSAGDGTAAVTATGSGELHLVLQEGKTNIWNVPAAQLSSNTSLTFDGATPSAATRLVINVIPDGSTDVGGLRLNGDPVPDRYFAPWVLWNFNGWDNLRLVGTTEMSGMVLAPDAALDYNRNNPLRGQIIAESINITGAGEIHHWSHEAAPCSTQPEQTVTPTPQATITPTREATLAPTPEATVTPTPEASITPSVMATDGGSATTSPTTTAPVIAAPQTPSGTTTTQPGPTEQLAYTGFNQAWVLAVAAVLVFAGALTLTSTRIRQRRGAAGKTARH
jgi:choice-of-anchor A domain-containing protein